MGVVGNMKLSEENTAIAIAAAAATARTWKLQPAYVQGDLHVTLRRLTICKIVGLQLLSNSQERNGMNTKPIPTGHLQVETCIAQH